MRSSIGWASVSLLGSVAPAAHARTYIAPELYSFIAPGLIMRATWLTATCGTIAALLTLLTMYESPGAMLQFGYEAHVAWGAYLALACSVAIVVTARPRAARQPVESRVELDSPR